MTRKRWMRCLVFCLAGLTLQAQAQESPADAVNLYMGLQGNSNCVIGPQMPHGSVNPSPETPQGGHGGYRQGQPVRGFAQLHVSGTGWGRYGQILLSPQIGFTADETAHDSRISGEVARPYYYKAHLDRYDITAELAPSYHSVIYRFTYPEKGKKYLLLDLKHNLTQHIVPEVHGRFLGGKVLLTADRHILVGWGAYAGGFGSKAPYKVYFALQLDDKMRTVMLNAKDTTELYAQISLMPDTRETTVRVGVSMKSWRNALVYLRGEVGGKTLEQVSKSCHDAWDAMLLRVNVMGGSAEDRSLFYTALYHSLLMPRDRSGDTPRWDTEEPYIDDHYCVWDTWRTCYPLLTLINQSFVSKTIRSFIDRYRHDGLCTATFTSGLECRENQGGDDVDNIIADAFVKGVGGFDKAAAYALLRHDADSMRDADYRTNGWIAGEGKMMSCSYTLEYAYNDDCVARVARLMGDTETADRIGHRSHQWTQMFNPNLESHGFKGFIGPRRADGSWISIDPAHRYGSWVEYFYEDNSWAYTCFVPHDTQRLIDLCGGKERMVERLQYGFDHNLIGLYNEPEFLAPFLFTHCDRPDLTARYVQKLRGLYSLQKGYPDNEDSGAMGSWYVFTSIGIFPCAGQDFYYLLPPQFDDVILTQENGKLIRMKVQRATPEASQLDHVTLNGKRLDRWTITHSELADGADLIYYMK